MDNNRIYVCGILVILAIFLSFFYLHLIGVRIQKNFSKNELSEKLDSAHKYYQKMELGYIRELALVSEKQKEYGFVGAGEVKFVSAEEKDLARAYFPVNP